MLDNTGSAYGSRVSGSDATTTNTTATDVAGLSFPVGANEVWLFEAFLNIGSSSTAGTKYAVTFPSGGTMLATAWGTTTGVTAYTQEEMTASGTLTTTAWNTTGAVTTAAVSAILRVYGCFANGATPGTIQLQHAKVTSGTATVYQNSHIIATRIT